jgi:hypothetical protein
MPDRSAECWTLGGVSASLVTVRPRPRGAAALARRVMTLRLLGLEPADVLSRILVGALFLMLAIRIAGNSLQTGRVTGLLLVASEALVVVLMIIRRPARDVDRRWVTRLTTAVSMAGPPLVQPLATAAGGQDLATAAISALGLGMVIASKLTLGRSFGVVPANRGVVSSGTYRFVRHPIYLGYLVTHIAFLIANPLPWNFWVLGAADTALILRSLREERALEYDEAYVVYEQQVRWRLLPGIF